MPTLTDITNHIKQDKTALTNLSDVAVKYMKGIPANTTAGSWYIDNASGITDSDTSIPTDFASYDWTITQFGTKNGADKFQLGTNGASMYIRSNDSGNSSTDWSAWTKLIYLKETYRSGSIWYRVYSDGYIEQGGNFSNSARGTTITFPKAFTSTNYQALACINHADNGWTATTTACVRARTTSNMVVQIYYNGSNTTGLNSWFVCGY